VFGGSVGYAGGGAGARSPPYRRAAAALRRLLSAVKSFAVPRGAAAVQQERVRQWGGVVLGGRGCVAQGQGAGVAVEGGVVE